MEPISMTENLEFRVPVHLLNPAGFVAQKSGPETNLCAALAGGDEKQVFSVRSNDKEKRPPGEAMAAVIDAARLPDSPRSLDGQPRRPGSGQLLRPTVPHNNSAQRSRDAGYRARLPSQSAGAWRPAPAQPRRRPRPQNPADLC